MKGSHLAAIVGAAANHVGRGGEQLEISRMAVARTEENRHRSGQHFVNALELTRRLGADGEKAEADASFLFAVGPQWSLPRRRWRHAPRERVGETRGGNDASDNGIGIPKIGVMKRGSEGAEVARALCCRRNVGVGLQAWRQLQSTANLLIDRVRQWNCAEQ